MPGQHDNKRAREVCANIASGEIVVFDKAYVDFDHLFDLNDRGVWWVTRAKDNMVFRVVKNHTKDHQNIIKDQIIVLKGRYNGMGARLYAALCGHSLGITGTARPAGVVEILWDSIRAA